MLTEAFAAAAFCSMERQRGTAVWNGSVERQRGVRQAAAQLQNAAGSDLSTGHGRALLQEKFDDRRVVGPCCRKSHQR